MDKKFRLFTSESVTEGHPDKVCDLIADSILDKALEGDPYSRVACEVTCTTGMVLVMGEFTTKEYIDIPKVVRSTIKEIGYTHSDIGFDADTCAVLTSIDEQSQDISQGVNAAYEQRVDSAEEIADSVGAGDQGMMFGYACDETNELMPLPIMLAHGLTKTLTLVRKSGKIDYIRPDGKAQVTVAYENDIPMYVDTVVVSTQHTPEAKNEQIKKDVLEFVIKPVLGKYFNEKTKVYINPTGRFVVGGPHGDSGLTGRKIIVDTYGGMCPHGGGSFSGKDATKVDRSACYYARYVCKNIVAAGIAKRCELQVAYAIGKAHPVSVSINTFSSSSFTDSEIVDAVNKVFDFRPYSIIEKLELRKPIFALTSNYGHFGKDNLPWERIDKVSELQKALKI